MNDRNQVKKKGKNDRRSDP